MWETTFPRNSHAGLDKDFTKMRAYSSVCLVRELAYPIRRGYFAEMLFPLWRAKKSHFRASEESGRKNVDKMRR